MSFRHSLPMMSSTTPTSTTFTNSSNGLSNGSPKKSSPRKTAKVGDSVTIDDGKSRGYLRFLGPTEFREGIWAGIELEEGLKGGRHDGMVDSVRYFKCPAGQGIFVHPSNVHYVSSPPPPLQEQQQQEQQEQEQQSNNPRESILPPFNDGEEEAAAKSQIHLELDKRSKELLLARDALHGLRKLNTTDSPTILLSVDHLDRSMGRYERQLRRFILEVKSSSKAEINCIQSKMELLQQQLLLKEQQLQQFLQQQEQQQQQQQELQKEEEENENQRIKKLHHDYNDLYEAKERQERYMQERIDFLEKELKSLNENTIPLSKTTTANDLQSLTEVQEAHKKKISDLERQLKERNEALARVEKDFSFRNQEEIENLYALLKKKDDMLELAEEELLSLSRRADLKEKEYDSGIGAGGRQASLLRAQLSEAESLLRQQAELIESISANGGLQGNRASDDGHQKNKKTKNNSSGNEEELQRLCKWQDDRIALLEAELEERRTALETIMMEEKKNTVNKDKGKDKDKKSTSGALTGEAARKILGEIVNINADSLLKPLRDLALFVKDFKPHNVDLRRLDSELQSILKELPECPHYLGNSFNDGGGNSNGIKDEDFTDTTIRIDGMMKKSADSLLREPF